MKKLHFLLLACLAVLLVACSDTNSNIVNATATPAVVQVNGFGTSQNHVHSLIILPDANHTLVTATHYGIFRSQDQGATWQKTAGGPNQLMQDVMTYVLSSNLLDPQRLYVMTYIRSGQPPASELGLFTSGDGGKTWQLSLTYSSLNARPFLFAQAGNDSPSEVYIYRNELGPLGLLVSQDNGQHFTQAGGPLPFGNLLGLLPLPGQPGHLIAYGNNGMATTTDDGAHWQVVNDIQGSIYDMTTPVANGPIYASGDAGIYVSNDDGKSFNLVYSQGYYGSLTASSQQPQVLYGESSQGVYRSSNGGKTWSELPTITKSLSGAYLAVDPTDANQVYLALSYPVQAYHFQSANKSWKSITPPV